MKKVVLLVSALCVLNIQATAEEGKDREVFVAGIVNTINVMKHQKEKAMNSEKEKPFYCLKLHPKEGEKEISDFEVIRLEALSLFRKESPVYYKDKTQKKHLCLTTAKTEEGIRTKEKYLKDKFKKILPPYSPSVTKVMIRLGYTPLIPSLGEWHRDMTPTVSSLNDTISSLKMEKKNLEKRLFSITEQISLSLNKIDKTIKDSIKKHVDKKVKVTIEKSPYQSNKKTKKKKQKAKTEAKTTKKQQKSKTPSGAIVI
ncbi:MAG TPA: hypothetical protein EYH42_09390 [Sulfurovum sp.]|nr:hypothetical protein [Sulfurovum sp.]